MAERGVRGRAPLAVVTTLPDRRRARLMARALVDRRLAACVHLWPIESCYRWQGRLQQEREYRLVCKTTAGRYAALAAAIDTLHPYELPALYAVPFSRSSPAYARWIEQSCREPRVLQGRASRPQSSSVAPARRRPRR